MSSSLFPEQLEPGKAAWTKDLDHISMASHRNKYERRKNGVEFVKIKQQNKINIIFHFSPFLVLKTKINIYDNVWARLCEGIFSSHFHASLQWKTVSSNLSLLPIRIDHCLPRPTTAPYMPTCHGVTEHCCVYSYALPCHCYTQNPWNFPEEENISVCLWINSQYKTGRGEAFNIEELNYFNMEKKHLILGKFFTPIFTNIPSLSSGGDSNH